MLAPSHHVRFRRGWVSAGVTGNWPVWAIASGRAVFVLFPRPVVGGDGDAGVLERGGGHCGHVSGEACEVVPGSPTPGSAKAASAASGVRLSSRESEGGANTGVAAEAGEQEAGEACQWAGKCPSALPRGFTRERSITSDVLSTSRRIGGRGCPPRDGRELSPR